MQRAYKNALLIIMKINVKQNHSLAQSISRKKIDPKKNKIPDWHRSNFRHKMVLKIGTLAGLKHRSIWKRKGLYKQKNRSQLTFFQNLPNLDIIGLKNKTEWLSNEIAVEKLFWLTKKQTHLKKRKIALFWSHLKQSKTLIFEKKITRDIC